MVSIPDWSKFGRLGDIPKQASGSTEQFYKQQAQEAVKQAEEHGYFLKASRSFIEQNFLEEKDKNEKQKPLLDGLKKKEKDLGGICMIKLAHAHMRSVGDIGLCHSLRILILPNNHITKLESLACCNNLIKLDLHGNQISLVPSAGFWDGMSCLKILLLHDNPIGKLENLHHLSACECLTVLTLYDTPLSLKRNYRHHVVNSIWTLQALDSMVISDEEIIEDAVFGGEFSAMHPAFHINLCPMLSEEADLSEEMTSVYRVLSHINRILAHHSPVLLIQRYARGFITRRKYGIIQHARDWAASTIQKRFRDWKGIDSPRSSIPPPPSSPTSERKPPVTPVPPADDTVKLDYDTYLRHRRPGSTGFSEASVTSRPAQPPVPMDMPQQDPAGAGTPVNSADWDGPRQRKNIFINLSKLQAGTLQGLQEEAITIDSALGPPETSMLARDDRSRVTKKRKEPEKKKRIIRDVKQFFGPVVQSEPSPEPPSDPSMEDEEVPRIHFRLRGLRQRVKYYDPTADMIISRREAGREIRAAEDEFHIRQPQPIPKHDWTKPAVNNMRIFARVQGTMGLSCLNAIQQAYKDRETAEKKFNKLEYVVNVRNQRDIARERIRMYKDDKRAKTMSNHSRDQEVVLATLDKRERLRLSYLTKARDRRTKSSQQSYQKRHEMSFIVDFSAQNTSVSNALLRHDRQAKREDHAREKTEVVQALRDIDDEQQGVVKKYMNHRQLMRQTESCVARATLDTRMLQEANERLIQARCRVAQQKARNSQVESFYPLPSLSTHSLPGVNDDRTKDMDRRKTSLDDSPQPQHRRDVTI